MQESKQKATQALDVVPEIRQLIAEAENKTSEVQQALADAEENAQHARNEAQKAQQKYAEQASQVSELCTSYIIILFIILKENLERWNDKKYVNKKEREQHLPGYCQ